MKEGAVLKLRLSSLIPGTDYTLRITENLSQWTTTTIHATTDTATWTIPAGKLGFYQVFYTP